MKLLYISLAGLIFVASCSPRNKGTAEAVETAGDSTRVVVSDEQWKSAAITIGKARRRNIGGLIRANGMLDVPPQNLVTVSAPLGGFVKNTDLLQGMKVKRGQVLVTLEHPDYIQLQQDYLDGKSQLEFTGLEYHRQEELAKENVNATKVLESTRAHYLSTKARVEGLEAKLKLINIDPAMIEKRGITSSIRLFAPIDGYITQVNINLGSHVSPADVMFRIMDNSHLHAEAQVFESDITKLKVGQKVRFTLAKDTLERSARVYLIGKEITAERTVRVHCHLDQEDPSLIPGMYFSAVIETGDQVVATLPDEAFVSYNNRNYVFVVRDSVAHQFEMTPVIRGESRAGFTQVDYPSGIPPEQEVVTRGAYELLSILKNKTD